MQSTREIIYSTIFAQLQESVVDVLGFKTASRRIIPFTQVPPENQPALFQTQVKENATVGGRGTPIRWDLDLDITIYVNPGSDAAIVPATFLNNAIDIIEGLFPGAAVANYCTLGIPGVQEIRVSGEVLFYEGVLDGGASVAMIPLHICAT